MASVSLADLDICGFVDPASGKKSAILKRTSSRSADVIVAQDALKRVFVLHAWAGRIPTTAHTDRIFKLIAEWPTLRVMGIDASAQQTLYYDSLLREATQRRVRLPLVDVAMKGDKDARIRTVLQPLLAEKRLIMREDQRDLRHELEAFPHGMTRDLVDALAEAVKLLPPRVASASEAREKNDLLRYLRETHAPAHYVQAVRGTAYPGGNWPRPTSTAA